MTALKNPQPGDILKHEFLEAIGLSQSRLAHAIGVPPNRIHAIVAGARRRDALSSIVDSQLACHL
jgi:addiction module HigA family antidote